MLLLLLLLMLLLLLRGGLGSGSFEPRGYGQSVIIRGASRAGGRAACPITAAVPWACASPSILGMVVARGCLGFFGLGLGLGMGTRSRDGAR
jgi:hypothetical protein